MSAMRRNDNEVGRYLTELRRSHASGIHDHKPARRQLNRRAIEMSILDGDAPLEDREPTKEELDSIRDDLESGVDADRFVHFDPEDYEYGPGLIGDNDNRHEGDEDYDAADAEWNDSGDAQPDGSFRISY